MPTEPVTAHPVAPGDLFLCGRRNHGPVATAIRTGQRLRGMPWWARQFDHVAIAYECSTIVEAESPRIVKVPFHYAEGDYVHIQTHVNEWDWAQCKAFLDSVLAAREEYGWATIAGLAVYCATGAFLVPDTIGTGICSGLACDMLTRAGYIWPKPPFGMMPGDVALAFPEQILGAAHA